MHRRLIERILWASACVLGASGAAAQPATPATANGAERTPRAGDALEEVIVTARKRDESVRDIPTSIDAFTGDTLVGLGFRTVEDVLRLTPGVTFEAGFTPSSTSIIVRGVTNDSRGTGPRTVGRFYGNVPLTNPSIMGVEPDLDVFDMRTVEVLKGPQGTLFGGSALAGAIRYEPNLPELGAWRAAAGVGMGVVASSDHTSRTYELMLNAPLGDRVALRFVGSDRYVPGFIDDARSDDDDFNDYRAKQGRLMASWAMTDALRLDVQYLKYEGSLGGFNYVEGKTPSRVRINKFIDDYEDSDVELFGGTASWDIGPATVVFEGNQLDKSRDQLNDVGLFLGVAGSGITAGQNFLEATDQSTYELRLVSNAPSAGPGLLADWNYVAGMFYMDSGQTRPVIITINFPAFTRKQGGGADISATEKAFYFDVTRNFGPWELNLGGRYFRQTTSGGAYRAFVYDSTAPGGIPPISFTPDLNSYVSLEDSGFNPKAALRWFASDNVTLVASYAQGYRFGGINGNSFDPAFVIPFTFASDEIDNFEVGLRTTWLDGRLTADVTAFLIDWQNLQVLQRASIYAYTDNVGAAEITGAEFALNYAPSSAWLFSLGGSYQDAKTTEFFNSGEWGPIQSGTRLAQSPRFTGNVQVRHARTIGEYDFDTTATYSYRSSSKNNLINTIPLDGYGTVDLAAAVQFTGVSYRPRLSLVAKNITDEEAATFGFTLGSAVNVISTNMPRHVALKFDLSF
jgi:outer membrane receptor protein involved in Fe transport